MLQGHTHSLGLARRPFSHDRGPAGVELGGRPRKPQKIGEKPRFLTTEDALSVVQVVEVTTVQSWRVSCCEIWRRREAVEVPPASHSISPARGRRGRRAVAGRFKQRCRGRYGPWKAPRPRG